MPNFWTITTQKVSICFLIQIAEAFSGPRTKDIEFDQKMEEMKIVEKSILNLKSLIQNYVSLTSGTKSFAHDFSDSVRIIYDRNSSFGSIGSDIGDCHTSIEKAYDDLISNVNDLNLLTTDWTKLFTDAKVKKIVSYLQIAIEKRDESRKVYDHYDEKMEKLYRSRQEKIRKNSIESPKEYELILRV